MGLLKELTSSKSTAQWKMLSDFIETKFAGATRNRSNAEINALNFFDAVNFDPVKQAEISEIIGVANIQKEVNIFFDDRLAEQIYYCVINTEFSIASGHISEWDQDMMKRHANLGLNNAPLKIFTDTFELSQKTKIYSNFVPIDKQHMITSILL